MRAGLGVTTVSCEWAPNIPSGFVNLHSCLIAFGSGSSSARKVPPAETLPGNSQHAQGERESEGTLGCLKDDRKCTCRDGQEPSVMLLQGCREETHNPDLDYVIWLDLSYTLWTLSTIITFFCHISFTTTHRLMTLLVYEIYLLFYWIL